MKTTEKIIIIDLEATCWNGKQPTDQKNEIIEIGVCVLNTTNGEITENKGILIQPTESTVSPFCTQLTTITQDLLNSEGIAFDKACRILADGYNAADYTWASYGAYDIKMLKSQCAGRNIDYPMSGNHVNVKELFASKKGLMKKVGMNGALHILDIPLEGTHHRGVDDAKNIAKILYWCLQQ